MVVPAPERALDRVADIAAGTGARLFGETFPARLERGAGRPAVERLAYLAEFIAMQLERYPSPGPGGCRIACVVLRLPRKLSDLVPAGCAVYPIAGAADDVAAAVAGAGFDGRGRRGDLPPVSEIDDPSLPSGELTAQAVCQALGALMPEGAIVSDEGNTSGLWASGATAGCPAP